MGRKRTSNDADFVKLTQYIVPKNKKAKQPPQSMATAQIRPPSSYYSLHEWQGEFAQ